MHGSATGGRRRTNGADGDGVDRRRATAWMAVRDGRGGCGRAPRDGRGWRGADGANGGARTGDEDGLLTGDGCCCCDEDDGTTPDGEATAAAATTTQLEKEMGFGA